MGVPPWELHNRTAAWVHIAVAAMNAEAHAYEQKRKISESKKPLGS